MYCKRAAKRRSGAAAKRQAHCHNDSLRAISGRTVHVALRKHSISLRADSIPVRKYDTELVFPFDCWG